MSEPYRQMGATCMVQQQSYITTVLWRMCIHMCFHSMPGSGQRRACVVKLGRGGWPAENRQQPEEEMKCVSPPAG